jgi:hypothetical protein
MIRRTPGTCGSDQPRNTGPSTLFRFGAQNLDLNSSAFQSNIAAKVLSMD